MNKTDEEKQSIAEFINRRRRQLLVHSILYYEMNENIITDAQWTKWAVELEEIQNKHPDIAAEGYHAEAFKNFEHSSGFNLPLNDPYAINKARQLLLWRDMGYDKSNRT